MYRYGLKLRGVGIGCQPNGFIKFIDTDKYTTGYWSIVYYDRKLTDKELNDYDIDFLGEE